MRKLSIALAAALVLLLGIDHAKAAVVYTSGLSAAGAVSATDTVNFCQNAGGCGVGVPLVFATAAQLKTFMSASPTLVTPIVGVATGTSIALGGCTIGTDKLCVTGTTTLGAATIGGTLALSTNTISGNFTISGTPVLTGLSTGTIASGKNLGLDASNNLVVATVSGGGGSISVSGGGNTTTGVTTLAMGNGVTCTPNGANTTSTCNITITDPTKSADYQVAAGDMANALNLTGTHTLTAPTASSTIFAPGMALTIAKMDAGTWTFTNSTGLTYNGPATFPQGTQGSLIANADGTHLDWFGSAPDGTTVVLSSGKLTAAGASATSITPGTTTIVGATAPCLIENSTSTTMACAGVGTGVLTAAANNVNTNGGLLTASTAAIAANAIVTGAGSGTALTGTTPGTGVLTALGVNVGSAGAFVTFNGALGTPSSGTATNITGLPAASVLSGALANGMTATTQSAASNDTKVATDAYVDAKQFTASIGWIATVNPNNALVFVAPAALTLKSAVGNVEVATGGTATVSVNEAASGTACSAGTTLHSGSFNANGTAATNQTLTLTTTAIASGTRLCLQTTGTTTWTTGTGVGGITISYTIP